MRKQVADSSAILSAGRIYLLRCNGHGRQNPANMKAKMTLVIVAAALVACTTGEKISQIRPGMTTGQVTAILGRPDGFREVGDVSYYQYSNRLTSGWEWDKGDYEVVFRNGRVISYGATGIRPNPVQHQIVTTTKFP
jgi:SmpA / OmlA family